MVILRRAARTLHRLISGRPPRTAWTLLVTLSSVCLAAADEPREAAPFARDLLATNAWDEQGSATATAQTPTEAALAARVAALEQTLRGIQANGVTQAADQETLPAGAAKAAEKECKQVDLIVKPTVQVTGRMHFDGVTYDDDDDLSAFLAKDRENEFGFRRFRIGAKGNIYENMIYTLEVEFRGTDTSFKDIYMEQQNLPVVGHLRAGHFKEPYSLEEDTSDNFVEFMERSTATTTFAPSRNFGVMLWNNLDECQDATWFTGVFRGDSPDVPNATGLWRDDRNDWCWTSRLAWLPYYDEPSNGRYLVHLGGSYSWRRTADVQGIQNISDNQNGLAQFSPLSWVGSQAPLGIGAEGNSDEWNQFGTEFLVIWGALSFQSEFYDALLTSGENYHGAYATVSYFLTGESRGYHKEVKLVDKVTPFEPAFWVDTCHGGCCGMGAWELIAGYSYVNLRDGHDTTPGTQERAFVDTVNIGVNWYQNTWSRVQINYEHEMTNFVTAGTPDADANIFGMRWAIYW